jgi:large subunit ribosomal protein L3
MAIAILGKKIGMTQFFDDMGNRIPATVVQCGPCQVLKVKTAEGSDGYDAVVLGLGVGREKSMTKPEKGVFAKLGIEKAPAIVREIRVSQDEALLYPQGEAIDVTLFQPGEKVDVISLSRGRGFTGVMKRHNFHGQPRTHGTHEVQRHSGSIGNRTWPGRTIKGMKMAGQHGNHKTTVLNQKVVAVYPTQNIILIEGGIPGAPNGVVTVRKAIKVALKRAR